MAETASVSNSTSTALAGATGSASGQDIGKEEFLELLVAQLTHQDPLNPMEGTEFTAQLAQFSSLEQLIRVNDNLGSLTNLEDAITQSQSVDMIGKQILAEGNTIAMTNGISSNIIFDLDKPTDSASINVFDADGALVSVFDTAELQAGQNKVAFAGFDKAGNPLPDGLYTFKISALDAEEKAVSVTTFSSGIVTGVNIAKDGGTNLQIGTTEFPLASVVQVSEPVKVPAP
jgi:flagellar basal-body rod modification protein FlgD